MRFSYVYVLSRLYLLYSLRIMFEPKDLLIVEHGQNIGEVRLFDIVLLFLPHFKYRVLLYLYIIFVS